jgi:hypothetical protein
MLTQLPVYLRKNILQNYFHNKIVSREENDDSECRLSQNRNAKYYQRKSSVFLKENKVAFDSGHRKIVFSFFVEIQLAEDHRKQKLS